MHETTSTQTGTGYSEAPEPGGAAGSSPSSATLYGYTSSTGGAPGLATDQMSPQERQR